MHRFVALFLAATVLASASGLAVNSNDNCVAIQSENECIGSVWGCSWCNGVCTFAGSKEGKNTQCTFNKEVYNGEWKTDHATCATQAPKIWPGVFVHAGINLAMLVRQLDTRMDALYKLNQGEEAFCGPASVMHLFSILSPSDYQKVGGC